jgi:hypothetical protein
MLGGKFSFTLPNGFTATPLSAGEVDQGTAGASGTMYSNATTRTVVIAAENTLVGGANVKDNDAAFLDATFADFAVQKTKALPDAKILGEQSLTNVGHHVDRCVRHTHGRGADHFPGQRPGGP